MTIELVREVCYKIAADHGFTLDCSIDEQHDDPASLGKVCYKEEFVPSNSHIGDWYEIERKVIMTEILFSSHFLSHADDEDILNVVRHELAHAFVFLETGKRQGHNEKFRAMCFRLGTKLTGRTDDNILKYEVPFSAVLAALKIGEL